jgi:hypothetical protein
MHHCCILRSGDASLVHQWYLLRGGSESLVHHCIAAYCVAVVRHWHISGTYWAAVHGASLVHYYCILRSGGASLVRQYRILSVDCASFDGASCKSFIASCLLLNYAIY